MRMHSFARRCLVAAMFFTMLAGSLCEGRDFNLEDRVEKFLLPNGLTFLVLQRHFSPTVAFSIAYRVGAVEEESGRTGTAHFLEHMLFKGTETIGTKDYQAERLILKEIDQIGSFFDEERRRNPRPDNRRTAELEERLKKLEAKAKSFIVESEIDRLYTENGGVDLNAGTGHDITTYYVSLPSNKVELWARIESDRMAKPVFREFYTERKVVQEERLQSIESNPHRLLMEQFFAAAFSAHPYRRPVIGWPSDIKYLNKRYVSHFYDTYYGPSNTVIAIVGDVKTKEIREIVARYFGSIATRNAPARDITEESPQRGPRRVEILFDAEPEIAIGYHKPNLPHADDYVFDLIDNILSDGRSSRLYRELVERQGIASSVNGANGLPGSRFPNLFCLFAKPRAPHGIAEVESALLHELNRLREDKVSDRELEKAKNAIRNDFIKGLSSNSGIAGMLTYFEVVAGDYRYISKHYDRIESLNADDIMRVARQYFNNINRTTAVLMKDVRS
ncbi:MAG: insulinase family protein [Deltaproteobacteria bacterium]|nr:insulinase family protein [Deltaproteobacteria bacterium]